MSIHYTPKIKMFSREPIPFADLVLAFQTDADCKYLRFGQWFYNRFLGSVQGDKRDFVDRLHAEQNYEKCKEMILTLYKEYQWPMV
jgi:hypothetical protein